MAEKCVLITAATWEVSHEDSIQFALTGLNKSEKEKKSVCLLEKLGHFLHPAQGQNRRRLYRVDVIPATRIKRLV